MTSRSRIARIPRTVLTIRRARRPSRPRLGGARRRMKASPVRMDQTTRRLPRQGRPLSRIRSSSKSSSKRRRRRRRIRRREGPGARIETTPGSPPTTAPLSASLLVTESDRTSAATATPSTRSPMTTTNVWSRDITDRLPWSRIDPARLSAAKLSAWTDAVTALALHRPGSGPVLDHDPPEDEATDTIVTTTSVLDPDRPAGEAMDTTTTAMAASIADAPRMAAVTDPSMIITLLVVDGGPEAFWPTYVNCP
ncbi:hypothetical protein K458DRAFT_139079 [Lentithecium fluviatile CBS 122367]|uniref:Uncharacterized protein n=1 Tax=Lentithecium fluviatile CBS 122367 TaxID=1168545 RepID=A0A6G1IKH9_9PLEO|nr:hypothetical protein K458DRAFT_139079 [Lentithecium fluviatile CBS 122367]